VDLALAGNDVFKLCAKSSSVTRGHAYKLHKPGAANSSSSRLLSCPVIGVWPEQPIPESANFSSVSVFKHCSPYNNIVICHYIYISKYIAR